MVTIAGWAGRRRSASHHRRPSRHRRPADPGALTGGRERGASLVEFAIVAPFLFGLIFGIIDYGLLLSDTIAIRQGVREAGRQAVVAEFGPDASCGATVTGGDAGVPPSMRRLVCLTKARSDMPGSDAVRVAIRLDPAAGPAAAGNGVIVCAIAPMTSRTGFYAPLMTDRYIEAKVVMRIEVTNGTDLVPVQEADPSGRSWSWCRVDP